METTFKRTILVFVAVAFTSILPCTQASQCSGRYDCGKCTCDMKKDITDKHNQLRALVAQGKVSGQSTAVDMTQMTWDNELAKEAQAWADRCVYKHTSNRNLPRFQYGQNMGKETYSIKPGSPNDVVDFISIIQMWFDEVVKYGYNGKYDSRSGHYSQVIWASSHLVGCGYSCYEDKAGYNIFYVCNYGPAGNTKGQSAYETGQPGCTKANLLNSKDYKGLCLVKGDNPKVC